MLEPKKFFSMTMVSFFIFLILPGAWTHADSTFKAKSVKPIKTQQKIVDKHSHKRDKKFPDAQVVNNSGIKIYKVKIGKKIFAQYIGSCSDGCSTGFKIVNTGINTIYVKIRPDAPWIVMGTLGAFEKYKHYAVNFVMESGGVLCAELYSRKNTDPIFNDDHTKILRGHVCKHIISPIQMKS